MTGKREVVDEGGALRGRDAPRWWAAEVVRWEAMLHTVAETAQFWAWLLSELHQNKTNFSDRCYGEKLYLVQFWAQSIKYFTNLEHTLQFSMLFRGQNCACFRIAPSWTVQYCAEKCANKITNSYFLCDVTNIRSWIILYLLTWEFILFYRCQSLLFGKSLWNSYQRIAIYC